MGEPKKITAKEDKEEFVGNCLSFISDKEWTISNVEDAISEVKKYMMENATLKELASNTSSD
ncbi:hypothetical protein [Enterococcus hirae]|uniref:hypothetical protein n=1 Tax=Enterococcus hirae TaxID=1354 RepID=UPI0039A497B4